MKIPFNRPYVTAEVFTYIQRAIDNGCLSGNGEFTKRCHARLESELQCDKALLTHSCTAALEMAAILADIQPGDEVIMPSYTFVSTANAFVLRGGVPIFVDIRSDTLNVDEGKIEAAITPQTKAIVPVHYAGVGCEMDAILEIAHRHDLWVIEDAAQGFGSTYKKRSLGCMGHLAALSFHETKNVISGEGGALLINDPCFVERAEIIWEKGTNRSQFFRGMVDKYSWVDIGSSYLPSEIIAAFLWSQLEEAEAITQLRLNIWRQYHDGLEDLECRGVLRRPIIPANCEHNGHMYYVLCPDLTTRTALIDFLKLAGINTVFHYVPLHSAPAGQRFGRTSGNLPQTLNLSDRLIRLPMFPGLTPGHVEQVIDAVYKYFAS